jgi:hypothetical protein
MGALPSEITNEYINGKSSFVDGVILQAYKKEIQNHL